MQHARTELAVPVISCNVSTKQGRDGGLQRLAGCHPSFESSEGSCVQGVRQSERIEDTWCLSLASVRMRLGKPQTHTST